MVNALNIEYLQQHLEERSDDVKHRYLLQKVQTAKEQVQEGRVEPSVARALVEYSESVFEPADGETEEAAVELDEAVARRVEGQPTPTESDVEEQTRELLKQMEADAIAEQNEPRR